MTKDELKLKLLIKNEALSQIHDRIYRFGGPLNNNSAKFNPKQLEEFQEIARIIDIATHKPDKE